VITPHTSQLAHANISMKRAKKPPGSIRKERLEYPAGISSRQFSAPCLESALPACHIAHIHYCPMLYAGYGMLYSTYWYRTHTPPP
jgi:hypothetical protein